MKPHYRQVVGGFISLALIVCSSCAVLPSRQDLPGFNVGNQSDISPDEEEGDGSEERDSASDQEREFRNLPNEIIYDHQVSFEMSSGGGGMSMTIQVQGGVEFYATHNGAAIVESGGDQVEMGFSKYHGSGNVPVNGTFSFWSDQDHCDCSFQDTIEVVIDAVDRQDDAGNIKINIALDETWYTNPQWVCRCSDPDLEPITRMNMQQMPAWKTVELKDRTLEFFPHAYGQSLTEEFQGPIGEGVYQWTFEKPEIPEGERITSPDPKVYEDNQPQQLMSSREGKWVPPLESIQPAVEEWFPIDH